MSDAASGAAPSGANRPGRPSGPTARRYAAAGLALSWRLFASALPSLAIPLVMAAAGASEAAVLAATAAIVLSHRLAWRLLAAPARREVARLAVRLGGRDRDLAAAQLRLAAVAEDAERLAADGAWFALRLGRDRRPRWAAPGCRAVLGVPPATVLAEGLDAAPADAAALHKALDTLGPGEAARLELSCRHADGGRVLLSLAAHHIGERGYLIGARDITRERQLETQVAELTRRLDTMLFEDRLTRLASRARLDAAMLAARVRARRLDRPLALVAVRVASHRAFADRYGTVAADSCLRRIARTLASTIRRPADLAVRTGGERFCLLLPDTDAEGAAAAARRVVGAVAALGIDHAASPRAVVEVRTRTLMLHAPGPRPGEPAVQPPSGTSDLIRSKTRLRTAGSVMR
ncbi:MAG: diguanylate cyclase [Rhodospirillales bacterium]|nr:diguanylate cyclase [Rhodospirillales bacterium]